MGREEAVPNRLLRVLDGTDVRDQKDIDAGIEALLDADLVVRARGSSDREAAALRNGGHLRAEDDGVLARVLPLDPDPVDPERNVRRRDRGARSADDLPEGFGAPAQGELEFGEARVLRRDVRVLTFGR